MGVIQEIAPNPAKALDAGIGLAQKIAACGPLVGRACRGPSPGERSRSDLLDMKSLI
jgi:hypothetical protein